MPLKLDLVSEDVSKPVRTLSIRMVREQPSITNKQIVVNIPQVRKAIPLFLVFSALGVISDKEIIVTVYWILKNMKVILIYLYLVFMMLGFIFTQNAALEYIKQFTKGIYCESCSSYFNELFFTSYWRT